MFRKIFTIFLPTIGGIIVGLLINGHIDYNNLKQPPLSPPSFIFPIAWAILYLLIGISYFLYLKKHNEELYIYYSQLIFNFMWSIIFFIFKLRVISFIWIIILIIEVIILVNIYKKYHKVSFYMLIPYIIWLIYAAYLNLGVAILN